MSEDRFLLSIDKVVKKVLPRNWFLVGPEKLPRRGHLSMSHAFGMGGARKGTFLNILPLKDLFGEYPPDQYVNDFRALRKYLLEYGSFLLILIDGGEPETEYLDFLCEFDHSMDIEGQLILTLDSRESPLSCEFLEVKWSFETFLSNLWKGFLHYDGPKIGKANVGIELMDDVCWRCDKPMMTVTGIVIPNEKKPDWESENLQCFQRSLPLIELPEFWCRNIAKYVSKKESHYSQKITPVRLSDSSMYKNPYWAANCPHCDSLRGDHHVQGKRFDLLCSREKRNGLFYLEIEGEINVDLLDLLGQGDEGPPLCIQPEYFWVN